MEKLVERAKSKEESATEEIIEKFKYLIFKEASKYHIPGFDLADLIQHGYLSVIRAIAMYKLGSNSFNKYCISSIKMNFKELLKGQIKHFREVPNNDMLDFDICGDYEFTLEDEVIAYYEVEKLYAALDKLDPLEREIIKRYYILDQSLGEIACDSDKNYHQLTRIKRKALEKLRSLM
ncbi:sigma-70 family RNA polymerase sigma factor [Clostridium bowmanii]|uniref:sigma-70 family RNA polymerase sigma factor n=1 Tax=Clostridium bowmanii TaxID=132925 RepID=UPI001C0C40CC|nr:sigma-70 family RNA polymerase sigma factor [Clostridium bowmanii]MBU3188273.1 sigma-70 family RNA polymerase sigma factor [Clostridium bowmanii]MCA1072660.1 sigma-70 family RNA polymerase sigma factor [Clostridium bowmanii]